MSVMKRASVLKCVCCGTDCETVCANDSAWWGERTTARLSVSFASVNLTGPVTGPSFACLGVNPLGTTLPAFGTGGWMTDVIDASYWSFFKGTTRPVDFYDTVYTDGSCSGDFTFDTAQLCQQAGQIYDNGNDWITGGTPPGSEDSGVTFLGSYEECLTRTEMMSCPALAYKKTTFLDVPYYYPNTWTTIASVAAQSSFAGSGSEAYVVVSYPWVDGVRKIRIVGYTAMSVKITGAAHTIAQGCSGDLYTFTPAAGCWKYAAYWFFYEGDLPSGFPCTESSWTFNNQLTKGYTSSQSTSPWNAPFPFTPGTYSCDYPSGGQFNIGSGGSVTLTLTSDGC